MKAPKLIKFLPVFLLLNSSLPCFSQTPATVRSAELNEISGLAISRNNTLFVHNDSGDTSRFFAIDTKGELLCTYYFKGDPARKLKGVLDCEDIAYGPGPDKGKNYIYLGDIGDNSSMRPFISVYRIPEPGTSEKVANVSRELVHLKYPNGPQDSETMMVDPIAKELVIISKRQDTVGVFSTPLTFKDGDTVILQKRGTLHLPAGLTPSSKYIVAGDISSDGSQILIKTYQKVYYWPRQGDEPLIKALSHRPADLPYTRERQGEAISFAADGKGYYCISEGLNPAINYYPLNARIIELALK